MSKRKASASEDMECSVCLDTITQRRLRFPFDCGHHLCSSCDSKMFRLADDRCPTCRKPRTSDSVQEGMERLTPEATQARRRALATAEMERSPAANLMFFPVQMPEDMEEFTRGLQDGTQEGERLRISVAAMMSDGRVRAAIQALVNADSMPMAQFVGAVSELRRASGGRVVLYGRPVGQSNSLYRI